MADKQDLVVIGNGMAGAKCVEEILQRGGRDRYNITVFGDEPGGNYNRILLSGVMNGSLQPQDITLNPRPWYAENGITLHAPVRVARIDRSARRVFDSTGQPTPFDQLIVAAGSRPLIPDVGGLTTGDGHTKPGVHVFRTLDDCHRIAGYANKCRTAVVVGGGLLGLEAARGLMKFGLDVHVVHRSSVLMNAQLDTEASRVLQRSLIHMGIHVHLNKETSAILGDDAVEGVLFHDGTLIAADMVIFACGIVPNVEVARNAGLDVHRGIVVTDTLQTPGDPNIYAVGECAEHRGVTYGLVAPAWEQAAVLADVLTGVRPQARYHGSRLATKLKVAGLSLSSMGQIHPEHPDDDVVVFSDAAAGSYYKLVIRNDRLAGAILLGDTDKAAVLVQHFDRQSVLPRDRRTLLFDLGNAAPDAKSALLDMPDSAKICNCLSVTKGAVRKCVEGGNRSFAAVQAATRAGTGCGGCKPLLEEVVAFCCDGAVPDTAPVSTGAVSGLSFGTPEAAETVRSALKELILWATGP